jgi:hypothetical protein
MAATHTGDALNALVRVLLAKTAANPAPATYTLQSAKDAKRYFGSLCAYCREKPSVELDHAVPINREHLGEHHRGTLIPSCRECNAAKGRADFREFLALKTDGAARIAKIQAWMRYDGYIPLGDEPLIKASVEAMREDVARLLEKCVAEIRLHRARRRVGAVTVEAARPASAPVPPQTPTRVPGGLRVWPFR